MMTISDIFDALTANDRPYKPKLHPEEALEILEKVEMKNGNIDANLFRLFVEAKVWEKQEVAPFPY